MNSRIFTETERKRIHEFLDGKVRFSDPLLRMIRFRLRNYSLLSSDVDLFVQLREAVAARTA